MLSFIFNYITHAILFKPKELKSESMTPFVKLITRFSVIYLFLSSNKMHILFLTYYADESIYGTWPFTTKWRE